MFDPGAKSGTRPPRRFVSTERGGWPWPGRRQQRRRRRQQQRRRRGWQLTLIIFTPLPRSDTMFRPLIDLVFSGYVRSRNLSWLDQFLTNVLNPEEKKNMH